MSVSATIQVIGTATAIKMPVTPNQDQPDGEAKALTRPTQSQRSAAPPATPMYMRVAMSADPALLQGTVCRRTDSSVQLLKR